MGLLWTHSSLFVSFLNCGAQSWTQYARYDLTSTQSGMIMSISASSVPVDAAQDLICCSGPLLLMFSLSIRTPVSSPPFMQPESGEPYGTDGVSEGSVFSKGMLLNLAGSHAVMPCYPPVGGETVSRYG